MLRAGEASAAVANSRRRGHESFQLSASRRGGRGRAPAAQVTAQAQRKALVTGITGQDGSYLAELLVAKGYEVHGIRRRSSSSAMPLLDPILQQHPGSIVLHTGDMTDASALAHIVAATEPDEVFNLAAQSHVAVSFDAPAYTAAVNGLGTIHLLEAVRLASGLSASTSAAARRPAPRFYQASTSELFGGARGAGAFTEESPLRPRSPYGAAKLMAYWAVRNYREAYGLFACNGILFNHESPRRGETFVTRKVTRAVAAISLGLQECVTLGNLDAKRDWGHARDYVECMWSMLQRDAPDDYIVATGESRSVREFCEEAFAAVGEVGVDAASGAARVRVSPEFYRPTTEVEVLLGDPSKAVRELGFNPRKTSFRELVREMVAADNERLKGGGGGGGAAQPSAFVADDGRRSAAAKATTASAAASAAAATAATAATLGDDDDDWLEPTPRGPGPFVDDTPFVWPTDEDEEAGDGGSSFRVGGRFFLPGEMQ